MKTIRMMMTNVKNSFQKHRESKAVYNMSTDLVVNNKQIIN